MPPVKKQSRPRIDAIVRHIKSGSYDDEIDQIKAAIDERNKARQEAVLKLVHQVFGDKARVDTGAVESKIIRPGSTDEPEARPRRQRPGGPAQVTSDAVADALSDDPEIRAAEEAALARERELEAEMAASGDGAQDEEAGVESNSPLIGSIPS